MLISRMANKRVYIVDDDAALRRTVRRMLAELDPDVEEFDCAETFLRGYSQRAMGCVLLDMRLPGMSGLDLLKRICALPPANPVIMLSGFGDIPSAVRSLQSGALDFLQKPFGKEQLLRAVAKGLQTIAAGAPGRAELQLLTQREREVLHAFSEGASNKVVAAELGLSPRTIEMHRARIFKKLRVANLSQALLRARDARGLAGRAV